MSSFHDVKFPLPLAFGASGGPSRTTEIITLANGREHRNATHAHSRRRYDAGIGMKSLDDLHSLISFYEARHGELYAFRFRDPMDHKSCIPSQDISATDQTLGVGDGTQTDFQLVKSYSDTGGQWQRPITKPKPNTVLISVNGQPATGVSVEYLSGVVSFSEAPKAGEIVRAGFEFDVPVRFAVDHLSSALEAFGAGQIVQIPLIEVLSHA